VYAVPAGVYKGEQIPRIGEWIMNSAHIPIAEYEEYARQFNPVKYDAEEWVRIARDAGMKYMVITSKHHDGFCLWDSEVSAYDVIDFAPVKRDLLAELKAACDKYDMHLGFYHSIMDWHHPDAQAPHYPDYNTPDKSNPNFDNYVQNYLKPQVRELIVNYDPDILWFDGEWIPEWTHAYGQDMYHFVRSLKPEIIVNNRVDKGRQGMQGMTRQDRRYAGDFGTPEQEILEGASALDWESCMTMNDTWGFKSHDDNWKSAETLIHNLIDITAKGGNYLLNVGPDAEGVIPQASRERLAEMGKWLNTNGEAVYSTNRYEPFRENETTYYTRSKDNRFVYAISTSWPGEQLALSHVLPEEGSEIRMLGFEKPLNWRLEEDKLIIDLPESLRDNINPPGDYAWSFRIEATEE
jgi:alpha-L-fucosidase